MVCIAFHGTMMLSIFQTTFFLSFFPFSLDVFWISAMSCFASYICFGLMAIQMTVVWPSSVFQW